jgi:hypothetical protein
MNRATIRGVLDTDALAKLSSLAADAQRYRPTGSALIEREVLRLFRAGMSPVGISAALRANYAQVVRMCASVVGRP